MATGTTIIEVQVTLTRAAATTGVTDVQQLLAAGWKTGSIRRVTIREDDAEDKGSTANIYITRGSDAVYSTLEDRQIVYSTTGVALTGDVLAASLDTRLTTNTATFPDEALYIQADITAVGGSAATTTVLHASVLLALEE